MGSFLWDHEPNDICYTQYHNGRPLSVALVEPCEPEPMGFIDNDFILNHHPLHQHCQQQQQHQRSRSLGRRFKRESYRTFSSENSGSQHCCFIRLGIHYPNTQFSSCLFSAPLAHRSFHYGSSGNGFVEKLGRSDERRRTSVIVFVSIAIDD